MYIIPNIQWQTAFRYVGSYFRINSGKKFVYYTSRHTFAIRGSPVHFYVSSIASHIVLRNFLSISINVGMDVDLYICMSFITIFNELFVSKVSKFLSRSFVYTVL